MAYELQREESVQDGLRRVAIELIDTALRQAEHRPDGEDAAVHRGRRACKSLRALIRLVEPVFEDARAENACFRDAAQAMSGSRDRLVMWQTAEKLTATIAGSVGKRTRTRRVADAMRDEKQAADEAVGGAQPRLESFAATMRDARERAERWTLEDHGFDAIRGGLGKRYKQGRHAMAEAREAGGGGAFHEWRKRAKDFDHHLRLLTPMWNGPLRATRKQASKLGDFLGDHHDLALLSDTLAAEPDRYGGELAVAPIREAAEAQQRGLEAEALRLGQRLYAERRKALLARFEAYWHAWRQPRRPGRAATPVKRPAA